MARDFAFSSRIESTRLWSLPFNAGLGQVKGDGQPLTPTGMNADSPEFSRDGKKLAFRGEPARRRKSESGDPDKIIGRTVTKPCWWRMAENVILRAGRGMANAWLTGARKSIPKMGGFKCRLL